MHRGHTLSNGLPVELREAVAHLAAILDALPNLLDRHLDHLVRHRLIVVELVLGAEGGEVAARDRILAYRPPHLLLDRKPTQRRAQRR